MNCFVVKFIKSFQFGNGREIQEDSEFFRRNPTISERIHCVLFVANADQDQREHNNVLGTIQKHLGDNSKCYILKNCRKYQFCVPKFQELTIK